MSENKFSIPFIYQLHDAPHNAENLPNQHVFELEYDAKYDLFKQKFSPETDKFLTVAYKLGSVVGGNTLEDQIGQKYTNAVLEYIKAELQIEDYQGMDVLEIGCGIGFLLSKIKEKGGSTIGVEPGIQGQEGASKYGIDVVQGFYPGVVLEKKFDLIISYLVLEHIVKPEIFIKALRGSLNPGGKVVIVVPNAEPFIESGDISSFYHEHWCYFTQKSLSNLLKSVGCEDIKIAESNYGGLLFSNFSFGKEEVEDNLENNAVMNSSLIDFTHEIKLRSNKIIELFNSNEDIGVYVPGRIVNYLVHYNIDFSKVRFFDDDVNSYGKYFPGINIKVENFEDFKKNPPATILIMSNFFEEIIRHKIVINDLSGVNIVTWSDVFIYN
jgi:SAM-dependent methyltransferase